MTRAALAFFAALVLGNDTVAQAPPRPLVDALGAIYRLHDFTVFDWIGGRYDRGTLTLEGFARTPTLKKLAEDNARKVSGIDEIVNRIETLPPHAGDDDLRVQAYAAIYATTALERYMPGGNMTDAVRRELADAARLGLDAVDVGRGPHGIHIIISGARVRLQGQVRAAGDRQQAEMRVRTVPGVLGVINELRVAGQP
jgi:osmotically-inducible protein OsmY